MAGSDIPQYNLDEVSQKVILEKAKRRATLREEFIKLKFDPFRHASGEGGAVFDSALLRHQAMKASVVDYFRPSGRNILHGLLGLVIPFSLVFYACIKKHEYDEGRYRRGEVAYRDRRFKLV